MHGAACRRGCEAGPSVQSVCAAAASPIGQACVGRGRVLVRPLVLWLPCELCLWVLVPLAFSCGGLMQGTQTCMSGEPFTLVRFSGMSTSVAAASAAAAVWNSLRLLLDHTSICMHFSVAVSTLSARLLSARFFCAVLMGQRLCALQGTIAVFVSRGDHPARWMTKLSRPLSYLRRQLQKAAARSRRREASLHGSVTSATSYSAVLR